MAVPPDEVVLTPEGDLLPGQDLAGGVRIWPYTRSRRVPPLRRRGERWVDPLNLLVIGAGVDALAAALESQGWATPPDGRLHVLRVDGRMRRMAAQLALGPRSERTHLRVWALGPALAVAAHHEVAEGRRHRVTSWDAARAAVAAALGRAGYAQIEPTGVVTRPNLRGLESDGRVWRLLAP